MRKKESFTSPKVLRTVEVLFEGNLMLADSQKSDLSSVTTTGVEREEFTPDSYFEE